MIIPKDILARLAAEQRVTCDAATVIFQALSTLGALVPLPPALIDACKQLMTAQDRVEAILWAVVIENNPNAQGDA